MRSVAYHIQLLGTTDIAINHNLIEKINQLFYDCKWDESKRFYSELMNRERTLNNEPLPRPDFICIFSTEENGGKYDVGVCTIVIENNNLILENSCIKAESSAQGLFAQFRKTLFYELIYGKYELSKAISKITQCNNLYFISFMDSEQSNYKNLKRINNACSIDNDRKIFNYIKKTNGFKKKDFPNLNINWGMRGYQEAFVIRVHKNNIVTRLPYHDSEIIDNTYVNSIKVKQEVQIVSNVKSKLESTPLSPLSKSRLGTAGTTETTDLYVANSNLIHTIRQNANTKHIGKGLYTKNTISKGANICNFEGTIFHVNELDEYTNKYKRENGFWGFVQIDKQHYLNTYESDCFANYINSPQNTKQPDGKTSGANAKMVVNNKSKMARVKAIKEINANEEILMSYGPKFKF